MNFRTDLALERREMINDDIDGVEVTKTENDECKTTIIEIKTEKAVGTERVQLENEIKSKK